MGISVLKLSTTSLKWRVQKSWSSSHFNTSYWIDFQNSFVSFRWWNIRLYNGNFKIFFSFFKIKLVFQFKELKNFLKIFSCPCTVKLTVYLWFLVKSWAILWSFYTSKQFQNTLMNLNSTLILHQRLLLFLAPKCKKDIFSFMKGDYDFLKQKGN